jgi:hypothetical protein
LSAKKDADFKLIKNKMKKLFVVVVLLTTTWFAALNANEKNNSNSSVISASADDCFRMYDTECAGFWYLKARNNCGVKAKLTYSYTVYYKNGEKDGPYKGTVTISSGSETVITSGNSRNSSVSYDIIELKAVE